MRPKKHLGQNFLINRNAAIRIVSHLNLKPGERVIEIGGGRGDLTCHLLETGAEVTSIEIDRGLADVLSARFTDAEHFHLIRGDILQTDPATMLPHGTMAKLVGNIPYNLTTPILEWIIEHRALFPLVVMMVQKEVAMRLAAQPGGKDFGSLTVFVQLFYDVKRIFALRPGSFFPKPTIDSAVIELRQLRESHIIDAEYKQLRRLTSACFRWRRKTIVRILREEYQLGPYAAVQLVTSLSLDPNSRPEQLAVPHFVALMRELKCVDRDPS
jgi:16S rRNA (adenine1518-N6/adenine1519-N6)-dimethyltransferase